MRRVTLVGCELGSWENLPPVRTANGGALRTPSWEHDIGVHGVPNWQTYPMGTRILLEWSLLGSHPSQVIRVEIPGAGDWVINDVRAAPTVR